MDVMVKVAVRSKVFTIILYTWTHHMCCD